MEMVKWVWEKLLRAENETYYRSSINTFLGIW
jgi:hypothetical protein